MPLSSVCFRVRCGLFLGVYMNFMTKRVIFVFKMHTRLVSVRNRVDVALFVFLAAYLLCCGDVELNPGPTDSSQPAQRGKTNNMESTNSTRVDEGNRSAMCPPSQASADSAVPGVAGDVSAQILEMLRSLGGRMQSIENTMSTMASDMANIKNDVGQVKTKCEEIGQRCGNLEKETQLLTSSLIETQEDVETLFSGYSENKTDIQNLSSSFEKMKSKVETLEDAYEKLESFSRRDNLKMFGVPQTQKFESYDTCASLVADTLNRAGPRHWTPDDISRAHRVGVSRDGQPQPMIVKFQRWKDKMAVITNRDFRGRLKESGVRVANDLTKKQASLVSEARKEGKVAYFKKGRLVVEPRQPGPQTYAEAAATARTSMDTSASAKAGKARTPEQPEVRGHHSRDSPHRFSDSNHNSSARGQQDGGGRGDSPLGSKLGSHSHRAGKARGQNEESRRGEGDSSLPLNEVSQSVTAPTARGQRGVRRNSARGSQSSTGLHHSWSPRSSPPVNKCPANNTRPRRSTRNAP